MKSQTVDGERQPSGRNLADQMNSNEDNLMKVFSPTPCEQLYLIYTKYYPAYSVLHSLSLSLLRLLKARYLTPNPHQEKTNKNKIIKKK